MNAEPPFRTVAIAGLGLIGGSLALALRDRWPSVRVTGVDTDSVIAHVRGSGVIDASASELRAVGAVDLVVLAAPVQQNLSMLAQVGAATVVTDVGSTKRVMVDAARTLRPPSVFIGGHPLGGAERGGFAYARADLFADRPWILTPDTDTPADLMERLTRFVAGLGARPVSMAPDAHDRVMAYLSHLPQLVASVLMEVVGAQAGHAGLTLAGRGLIDTTRLAASPANVWRDVCQTNEDVIGEALDLLIARLVKLRGSLDEGDAIDELFSGSARWRSALMKGRE